MQEIERKYLVNESLWNQLVKPQPKKIVQGYLSNSDSLTTRVRIKNEKGYLTLKGKTVGITRSEFEYEIPLTDAQSLLDTFASKVLEKERYEITVGTHLWEVDVFHGKLAPLILAEIELSDEHETFELPEWVTEEVSHDASYYNVNLIKLL